LLAQQLSPVGPQLVRPAPVVWQLGGVHTPLTQVCPEGHALLHEPQCALEVRRDASHPSEKVPLQSAKELLQRVIVHAVPEHPAVATFAAEHGEHELPQVLALVLDAQVVPHR
jgi:hypothetical protein